jgi:hypothetical protein
MDQFIDATNSVLRLAFALTSAVAILLLAPLAMIRVTRAFSVAGFIVAGWIFGIMLWVTSVSLTFQIGGLFWTIFGILTVIGIVPIASICTIIRGEWVGLLNVAMLFVGTWGFQMLAGWITVKTIANEQAKKGGEVA